MRPLERKAIIGIQPLGEDLRAAREQSRKSVADIADAIDVSEKYLRAIERGRYRDIPGEVYAKTFVKKYAAFLDLDAENFAERFDKEKKFTPHTFSVIEHALPKRKRLENSLLSLTSPTALRVLLVVVATALLAVFVGLQVTTFLSPPLLTITNPATNMETGIIEMTFTGKTSPDVRGFLNGQEIPIGAHGAFAEILYLHEGTNVITITVRKKNGRQTTATRTVFVTPQQGEE